MKKLFFLMFGLLFFFAVQSQDKKRSIKTGETYVSITDFSAKDTLTENKTTYVIQVESPQRFKTTQDVLLKLDSISTPNVTIQLQGSKFGADWTDIGSAVVWSGSTGDTTIIISNVTANRYRAYKTNISRNAGDAKITAFEFKEFFE
jgi:hypothetical protein